MADYPDYWPKQMRFRKDINRDDAHRRKSRFNAPGSYRPSYGDSDVVQEEHKNSGSINHRYTARPKPPSPLSEERLNLSKPKKKQQICTKEQKERLLYRYVFYHPVLDDFEKDAFLENKNDEYVLIFSYGNKSIGALYNGNSIRYKVREFGEIGSLDSLFRVLGHLTIKDRCINLVGNENWLSCLGPSSEGCKNYKRIQKIVEELKQGDYVLKVWHYKNDDNLSDLIDGIIKEKAL